MQSEVHHSSTALNPRNKWSLNKYYKICAFDCGSKIKRTFTDKTPHALWNISFQYESASVQKVYIATLFVIQSTAHWLVRYACFWIGILCHYSTLHHWNKNANFHNEASVTSKT